MGNLFRSQFEVDKCLILTPEVFKTLEESNEPTGEVIQKRNRHFGDKDLSPELRTLIGLTGSVTGPQKAAKMFNVSPCKASELARGIVSEGENGRRFDESLRSKVIEKKLEVNKMAIDLMFEGMGTVHVEEIRALDVKDRLKALKDIGDIADKTAPVEERENRGSVIQVYAPIMVKADSFEMLLPENA